MKTARDPILQLIDDSVFSVSVIPRAAYEKGHALAFVEAALQKWVGMGMPVVIADACTLEFSITADDAATYFGAVPVDLAPILAKLYPDDVDGLAATETSCFFKINDRALWESAVDARGKR